MNRILKYILATAAVLVCLVVGLVAYAIHRDQERFAAAKNECERGCIQDSGGLESCRKVCEGHPGHYP